MECNGWSLWMTTVWWNEFLTWQRCLKRIRGGVVRSKKQTEWDTVDHWHARGGGLLSNDWLEDKKTGLNYKRDVCDALVASRPWNDCIQKNSIKIQSWLKSKWSRIQRHSNEKINGLVWTNGVSWTIHDDWQYRVYEGWARFGKSSHFPRSNGNLMKKMRNEHPAGVAPPCRPPPAGCSEFPSCDF